jgi:cytochrome c oxidase subunit III
MATLSPNPTFHDPLTGNRGGNGLPPSSGNGGDRGENSPSPNYLHRLRRARLGMSVLFVPIVMLFVAFTSTLVMRQGMPSLDERTGQMVRDWQQVNLPIGLLLFNTALLLASSVTIEFARRQIRRQAALAPVKSIPGVSVGKESNFPWLLPTVLLGMGFLVGQWMAWQELHNRGYYVATTPGSSFVYLLTAAHAIHLLGGILALLYAGSSSLLHRSIESRRIVVDVAAWYWHFMAGLWIYVFALLVFMR